MKHILNKNCKCKPRVENFKNMKTIKKLKINWSIQSCTKFIKRARNQSSEIAYSSMKLVGRKKIRNIHKTLGEALKEVGV